MITDRKPEHVISLDHIGQYCIKIGSSWLLFCILEVPGSKLRQVTHFPGMILVVFLRISSRMPGSTP